jgi:hypothetical protein
MSILDWLNGLPPFWAALLAIGILDAPFGVSIVWLVLRVKRTVTKSNKLMDVAPDLSEEEKVALAWSIKRTIKNELELYRKARSRGEA